MKLWIDPIRDPKEHGMPDAVWCKSLKEALQHLLKKEVTFISLAQDLGHELDGYEVASVIEGLVRDGHLPIPEWEIHSASPEWKSAISKVMKSAERFSNPSGSTSPKIAPLNRFRDGTIRGPIYVGLDIGTSKICVAVSERHNDGTLHLLGIGEAPSRGIRKGEIVDSAEAAECIRAAVLDAEDKTNVEIRSVWVSITGAHLGSMDSTGTCNLSKERDQVIREDLLSAAGNIDESTLPSGHIPIHGTVDHYSIDGQQFTNLRGIKGSHLEAHLHLIHGSSSRIHRTLDCLESLQLQVESLVPSSVACTHGVLYGEKYATPLLIDLGGGTTDFTVIRYPGQVLCSGVLAVGGDHITNDLSIGLKLPNTKTELLKIQEGKAILNQDSSDGMITMDNVLGEPSYEIDRTSMDTIIHLRVREIFEQIRDRIAALPRIASIEGSEGILESVSQVLLTGGGSRLRNIAMVAEEVFHRPVSLVSAGSVIGDPPTLQNPAYTIAIGITRHAKETTEWNLDPEAFPKKFPKKSETGSVEGPDQAVAQPTEDLDIPTFLRRGTAGVEINRAHQI
jgi:cell division protein FtsA